MYIVGVYDISTLTAFLYIDRVVADQTTMTTGDDLLTDLDLFIAKFVDVGKFTGALSCLRVYNRPLTPDEVTANEDCERRTFYLWICPYNCFGNTSLMIFTFVHK